MSITRLGLTGTPTTAYPAETPALGRRKIMLYAFEFLIGFIFYSGLL